MGIGTTTLFTKTIAGILMLVITLSVIFIGLKPLFANIGDPCWGNFQSRVNMILPGLLDFGKTKTTNIKIDVCVDALVFQTTPNPVPSFCQIPIDKKEADKIKGYILGYPNPKTLKEEEELKQKVKKKIVNLITGERHPFCIPVTTKIIVENVEKKIIDKPGNYTIKIEKNADSYQISWEPTVETKTILQKMQNNFEESKNRAVSYYGLTGSLLTEFNDIKPCLKLLNENKRKYLLIAVIDSTSNWFNLKGFENIYLIKSGGRNQYAIYVEDRGDNEFEILDCHGIGFDWEVKNWERITLKKILTDGKCDYDLTPIDSIKFKELTNSKKYIKKYININAACIDLLKNI